MCVASQTPSRMILEANRRLGLEAYFETVYSCGEWNTHKREPEIYRLSADFLGALPGVELDDDCMEQLTTYFTTDQKGSKKIQDLLDKCKANKTPDIFGAFGDEDEEAPAETGTGTEPEGEPEADAPEETDT